jgi:hypothetical protein
MSLGEVLAQDQRDAEIWLEWVSGDTQADIAARRGIQQPAVSKAISRFLAATPAPDRLAFLARGVERMERLHRVFEPLALAEADKGAARIVVQAQTLAGRYLGLDSPAKLELYQQQQNVRAEPLDLRAEVAAILAEWNGGGDHA